MMRTVKEVSTLTGVSVRTLHHYDAIGLLKPTAVSAAGYRLYDETALRRLQSILLFRELQFPLKDIKAILDSPSFDPSDALQQQIELLELQQQRLTALIAFARELQKGGIHPMTFHVFNNNELDRYKKEAKERWQHTKEYQDYAQCHNDDRANQTAAAQLMGIFAKLGSDYKKPDATTVIPLEGWREMVWPLPVGDLLYVGGAARKLLSRYGIDTIGQLAACKPEMLEQLMGKMGLQLHQYATGMDRDPVRSRFEKDPVKSVGNGTTFPQNLTTREQVRQGIAMLSDSVASRLRHLGLYAGGIQVTVRDPNFRDRSRQTQLSAPTHLIREVMDAAMSLTEQLWKPPSPIRALTVTAIHLVEAEDAYEQVDLFSGGTPVRERREKLEAAMDRIRGKYGDRAITYGAAAPEKEDTPGVTS